MDIIKVTSAGPALNAAVAAFGVDEAADKTMSRWYTDVIGSGVPRALPVPQARVLLATVPDGPAGAAWAAAMRRCIEVADADDFRPFDLVVFDEETREGFEVQVEALADSLRSASALLDPVAEAVEALLDLLDGRPPRISLVVSFCEALSGVEIALGRHDDPYVDGYGVERTVPWDHIDALAPGASARIAGLAHGLLALIPETAEADATLRMPEEYR